MIDDYLNTVSWSFLVSSSKVTIVWLLWNWEEKQKSTVMFEPNFSHVAHEWSRLNGIFFNVSCVCVDARYFEASTKALSRIGSLVEDHCGWWRRVLQAISTSVSLLPVWWKTFLISIFAFHLNSSIFIQASLQFVGIDIDISKPVFVRVYCSSIFTLSHLIYVRGASFNIIIILTTQL